jgi:DNA (cytosine-5)-methyltransferase 1
LAAHVEKDAEAARTYALNFDEEGVKPTEWSKPRDMEHCSTAEIVGEMGPPRNAFDVVAAGLPCQAFARIGRSKLREIAGGRDDAFQNDTRASLYLRFLQFVSETQPLAIVVENVPDILNFGGRNVPEEICATLEDLGYRIGYTLLNAAYFGVPQARERFFLIALADDLELEPTFPEPTHFFTLPKGYEGSRRVALKHVPADSRWFREIHTPNPSLREAVGAQMALGDLPYIQEHWTDPRAMRRRAVSDRLPYRADPDASEYSGIMRLWSGFESPTDVDGNVVRITKRDFQIFAEMPHGADYPQARKIADGLFEEALRLNNLEDADPDDPERRKLWKAIVPPYDPGKFPNKWWKLDPLKPSRTLTAHMGKDTYSHIHYDSEQRRMVSVREAARLQSFPDGFRFAGAMNAAFRQIGNAVPPLLGLVVAEQLREQLRLATARVVWRRDEAA